MKKLFVYLASASISLLVSGSVSARDSVLHLPLEPLVSSAEFQAQLGNDVQFFFGDTPAPSGTLLGQLVTNKKTNAFNKSDEEACRWVMMSALIQLRDKAHEVGADVVANISSYYKKNTFSSRTEYECHAGGVIAGVALRGDFRRTKR